MKPKSLYARMMLVIAVVIALCWVGALIILSAYFTHNGTSTWDEKLQVIATQILMTIPANSKVGVRQSPGMLPKNSAFADRENLVFQVWFNQRDLVASTPNAPKEALRPDFADGATSTVIGGKRWRVYSVVDSKGQVNVQVANLHSIVDQEIRGETLIAVALATLLLLLAGVLMWFVVHNTLRPVVALGTAMRERQSFDLTQLPSSALPIELHSLVASFNHILQRLEEAVQDERQFIGNAAHELRTPLAALQAQAQIALRAPLAVDKDVALSKLLTVAQHSSRLSEQLLDLARLSAGTRAPNHCLADLSELVLHVAHEFDIYASQQDRNLSLDISPCMVRCDIDEIGVLLRNLIDNGLRYTLRGGHVTVSCGYMASSEKRVYLKVADNGPGVPPAEQKLIFDRFYRAMGTEKRGSGIGLSLVAGIALHHRATIETYEGLNGCGLSICVMFPDVTTEIISHQEPSSSSSTV
ncbi:HAMP domain-containing histidine kinase [Pseudomonas sp. KU26590]|uniref:HAMP domain-containing sensor histidine kinase n=1 Tax=Pseudomonas sp. KU26590 TaxID=2991051 RepID=UPI00223E6FC6|nr:HAMP domain-containing sensor histidine kinase [Pseudomonas sp. KU26590]UZJ57946.1 HAMP domain-containing histidine kinase [Pseudomonas sp. KU26590]